ncbi:MAG: CAP domain-containing protein [Acidobacteria bacterium]|nr:CAP domain-containing protein [Acidobacteriota bacterium]
MKLRLVERINQDRTRMDQPPVSFLGDLSQLADEHCREMLQWDYVSHWNRAGLKPYMRYSSGGITDHTAENIASLKDTSFRPVMGHIWQEMIRRHESLLHEQAPDDLHRKSILNPQHTHVGIGLAYDETGMTLIEVFAGRYLSVAPLPRRAKLSEKVSLRAKSVSRDFKLEGISIFYDELPRPYSAGDLAATHSYGFPDAERILRRRLPSPYVYQGGGAGEIRVDPDESFVCEIEFFKKQPGVYTVVVWLKKDGAENKPFMATDISIFAG